MQSIASAAASALRDAASVVTDDRASVSATRKRRAASASAGRLPSDTADASAAAACSRLTLFRSSVASSLAA
eukprot:scaffold104670_cov57-Phaeocystis_antarctica.AAC.1